MNRTFLIFLMIGTAMMIAVIGQHDPDIQLDYMPWEIDILENGKSRVFGVTLEKTTVQEANQIFANFAMTQLVTTSHSENQREHRLVAKYTDLTIGGLTAEIELSYQIDAATLESLYQKLSKTGSSMQTGDTEYFKLDNQTEMNFLNTPVNQLAYIPSVDYGESLLLQHFGAPKEEPGPDENIRLWHYPQMGLTIVISATDTDRFVYSPIK